MGTARGVAKIGGVRLGEVAHYPLRTFVAVSNRYRFNPNRLNYEPVARGWRYYLRNYGLYVVLTLAMAAGFVVVFYVLYDSPQVRQIKAQNDQLAQSVAGYGMQIDSMDATLTALDARNRSLYKEILNAEPIEPNISDSARESLQVILGDEASMDFIESRVSALEGKVDSQGVTQQLFVAMATERKEELARLPSIRPTPTEIISGFGIRRHPIFKRDYSHQGIDFKADLDSPVYATADGVVKRVGTPDKGLGLMVILDHGNGFETRYAHLAGATVRSGQRVKRGDVIARSGASGLCKGPHLYYEIRKDGKPVDPIDYFFHDLSPEKLIEYRRKAAQYNESMG